MTITLDDLGGTTATRRPEPKRDRYGRYVIEGRSWQRVTTLAKVLDDTSSLADWKSRMTAIGLTKRPDIFAQVATCSTDDRKALNALCEQAKEAAGASVKANLGTAVHAMCEQVDLGLITLDHVPEQWRADVAAYRSATAGMAWTHVEAILVNRTVEVVGTTDRIYRRIADVKTGSLDFAALGIAVQLACYANADEVYDPATDTLSPMPDVDKTTGLVIHLPVGEGTCTLYEVDLTLGWRYAQLAAEVRDARNAGRRKNVLLRPAAVTAQPTADVDPFANLPTVADKPFEPKPERRTLPTRIRATTVQDDDALNSGEGANATAEAIDAVKGRLEVLRDTSPAAFATLLDIVRQAVAESPTTYGISTKVPSQRRINIMRGLLALAEHFGDELADEHLRCVGVVIPDAQQLAVPIHRALLALTPAEARAFHQACLDVVTGDLALTFDDDAAPLWVVATDLVANPAA